MENFADDILNKLVEILLLLFPHSRPESIEMEPLDKQHKSLVSPLFMDAVIIDTENPDIQQEQEVRINIDQSQHVVYDNYSDLP